MFEVSFAISLRPLPPQSVHDSVAFSAASSVAPATMSWDFGDLSPRVNTSGSGVATAAHKYGAPGRYVVSVMGWAGNSKVSVFIRSHRGQRVTAVHLSRSLNTEK